MSGKRPAKVSRSVTPAKAGVHRPAPGAQGAVFAAAARWPVEPLAALAADEPNSVTDGPFGSKLKTEHYTDSGPRVIRLQNIGDSVFMDARAHISDAHFSTLQKHRVFAGDVVIAALGENPPRSCLVPDWLGPAIVKADCVRFKPGRRVLPKFVNYALNAPDLRRHAKSIIHGVGRPRLNLGEIKALPIPVPPLLDQERIVAEIEKQFTRLDAGVASLRRVQANLKRYRAAVLKAACEGRLVPTEAELARKEGRTFETGEQLLARILDERRKTWDGRGKFKDPRVAPSEHLPELPSGWAWAGMQQVGEVQLGRQRAPQHHTGDHMRPYLRVANVFEARIDTTDVKWMNFTPEEFPRYRLRYGDLLLNEGQTPELVGRPAMFRDEVPDCCYQKTLLRFRARPGVTPSFALTVFRAYMHNQRFTRAASITTNIAHLTAEKFIEIEFPLPPLAEQTRIVAEVERRLSVIDEIEAVGRANLQRATRMRQSVLQAAFSRGAPEGAN